MANRDVHMSHCNMGEYRAMCKYGEHDTCPALPENNLTSEEKLIGTLVAYSKDNITRNQAAMTILERKIVGAQFFLETGIYNFPENSGTLIYVINELGLRLTFSLIKRILRKGSWEAKNEVCEFIMQNKIEFNMEDYYS